MRWSKDIQKVTKLRREVVGGSTVQEVNFWSSMQHALDTIVSKQKSYEVQITLNCLKAANRNHAVSTFENDTGIEKAQKNVTDAMELMKNFHIDSILAATKLSDLDAAVVNVFIHLRKVYAFLFKFIPF